MEYKLVNSSSGRLILSINKSLNSDLVYYVINKSYHNRLFINQTGFFNKLDRLKDKLKDNMKFPIEIESRKHCFDLLFEHDIEDCLKKELKKLLKQPIGYFRDE